MAVSNLYALTISPPYRKARAEFLLKSDIFDITRLLNRCSKHWMMTPEFSEQSRLHYHGVVRIDDMIKWHKCIRGYLGNIGFVKLDKLKDNKNHISWLMYCYKDWNTAKQVFKLDRPFFYDKKNHDKIPETPVRQKTILDYL